MEFWPVKRLWHKDVFLLGELMNHLDFAWKFSGCVVRWMDVKGAGLGWNCWLW